jgi:serine/threonine protein kinase
MSEPDARCLFQQLIVAVDYCHKLGIANRDIKVCQTSFIRSWALRLRLWKDCLMHCRAQHADPAFVTRPLLCVWVLTTLTTAMGLWRRVGSSFCVLPSLQLDNMLLHGPWPRPQLKLCDFGFSKNEVMQSVSKSTCGTPEYMAPEVRMRSVLTCEAC